MTVQPLFKEAGGRLAPAGRAATLSAQIVTEMREALFEKRLKPGESLGTEKDIAARAGVSRIGT
jgi:GntR family transcriptional regulator, transcriptional repressor for pyruvate dehydrogenase complex